MNCSLNSLIFLFGVVNVFLCLWFVVFGVEVLIIMVVNFIIILVFVLRKILKKGKFFFFINLFIVDLLVGVIFFFLYLVYLGSVLLFWLI